MTTRLVVLVSGTGTTLQALLDAARDDPAYPASVVAVGADRPGTGGIDRAEAAGIDSFIVPPGDYADRAAWSVALRDAVAAHRPDWVVCAGLMRVLDPVFLDAFPQRVVNTHPALLPAFPGAHGVRDALAYGVRVTGATVHFVDSGIDTGPVLAQVPVDVRDSDDEATLHERIKTVERAMLVEVVARLATLGATVHGRKVTIP